MKYELKLITDEIIDLKLVSKAEDFVCALIEIGQTLRDIYKHEQDKDKRDVAHIRERFFQILEARDISLDEYGGI